MARYIYNDKCASGTGRFLEVMCVIFAETEVVSLVNEGRETADIVNALHHALAKSIEVAREVVMTGGVAKNSGVFNALAKALNVPVLAIDGIDPQIVGALGAALYARERASIPQTGKNREAFHAAGNS